MDRNNILHLGYTRREVNYSSLLCNHQVLTQTMKQIEILNVYIYYPIKILSVVLYGCETWSLTLREERRLRVFENRVLRRIFGSERDEVTGEWRKLHKEELNYPYCSPSIVLVITSRRMRWAGHVARMGRDEAYRGYWWGNLEGKRPLGRPRRR